MHGCDSPGPQFTLDAIGAALPAPPGWTIEDSVPFSSARSGARRASPGAAPGLGAPERSWRRRAAHVVARRGHATRVRAAELADEGLRVLLLSAPTPP